MMYQNAYHSEDLHKFNFLITGGAGFIGSNLVEYLLKFGAKHVRVLDNLSNGYYDNIAEFEDESNFEFIEGDIRLLKDCEAAVKDIDIVLHQAALGSVPRSIDDPITSNAVNVSGFLNMLVACKNSDRVKRFVYAASSSTYGDSPSLPKVEDVIGNPLSPYAVTKYVNELYADVFGKTYGMEIIGLRYFNVFGPKQSPQGAYAAVIPLFMQALQNKTAPTINGDGEQTRDFTFVENAVQANIKAAFADQNAVNKVYNVACGERISLNRLWKDLQNASNIELEATYGPTRRGDVRDSLAQIDKAKQFLNYAPKFDVSRGIDVTWKHFQKR